MQSKKTLIVTGIIMLILLLGLGGVMFVAQKGTELRSKAAPTAGLSYVPAATTKAVGETFPVTIQIVSGNHTDGSPNLVLSADVGLAFDASKLEIVSVTPGSFFTNATEVQKQIDNAGGKLFYSLYTPNKASAKGGSGVLFTVNFKGKAAGTARLEFDKDDTVISGVVDNATIVDPSKLLSASYTITAAGGGATSTPTKTPTATIRPGSSATPIRTPTATVQPTTITRPSVTSTGAPTPTEAPPTPTIEIAESLEAPPVEGQAIPVTGSFETTMILSLLGIVLLGAGIGLPLIR